MGHYLYRHSDTVVGQRERVVLVYCLVILASKYSKMTSRYSVATTVVATSTSTVRVRRTRTVDLLYWVLVLSTQYSYCTVDLL